MSSKQAFEVRFILAEDFREEKGGKITLLGLFAGDDIILEGEQPGRALPSLVMFILCSDGDRKISKARQVLFSSKLVLPSGKVSDLDCPKGTVEKKPGLNIVFAHKWATFPVPEFGRYTFTLSLDGEEYNYSFVIDNTFPSPASS